MGVIPGPLTLRELVLMAEGRRDDEWNHTSAVLAMLFNANRDPKKQAPARPQDFHPATCQRRSGRVPLTAETIGSLKAFVKKKR